MARMHLETKELSAEQQVQESQYDFPYHYIPVLSDTGYGQHRNMSWGYEYLSYLRFVLDRVADREFASLLDVGCGDGRFLREARRRFPGRRLVGIDYSKRAVELAHCLNPDVEFLAGDVTDPSAVGEKFDVVTLIEVLEHIPPQRAPSFLAGVASHLADDGRLVLTVPSNNRPVQAKHYRHFDLPSLCDSLAPAFEVEQHFFLNHPGWMTAAIRFAMTNRLFVLNEPHIALLLYRLYQRFLAQSSEKRCRRLAVVCRKAGS